MTVPHRPVPPFASALGAAANEGHARIDRDFLKQARIPHLRTAASGAEALKILRRDNLELVLCDTTLADMTGQAFVTALRADAALARTQVIMAAANPARADVIRAVAWARPDFFCGPIPISSLRGTWPGPPHGQLCASGRKLLDRPGWPRQPATRPRPCASSLLWPTARTRPRACSREGMTALAGKNLDGAITRVSQALELNALYVDSLSRSGPGPGTPRAASGSIAIS